MINEKDYLRIVVRVHDLERQVKYTEDLVESLRRQLATSEANLKEMVARNKLLRDRPDLSSEQYAERMGWRERVLRLEARVKELEGGGKI